MNNNATTSAMRYGACWNRILPGQRGQWGGIAQDNRRFINGVFWILRTGAPWRDLPPFYGKWGTVYQRFRRWRDKGIWEKLLEILVDEPDFEWLMIDPATVRCHPHAAGARGGNQDMSRTKGGSIPRFTLPWMPNGMPVRVLITEGTRADCKEAIHLIDGISAETLLADRGYDTNQIIAYAADAGMNIVIPAKRNRKQQREYDRYLYRLRHLVENAFFAPETLARHCYSICKNYNTFSGCCANSLHCYLVYCF